jgi:hypothetical protein
VPRFTARQSRRRTATRVPSKCGVSPTTSPRNASAAATQERRQRCGASGQLVENAWLSYCARPTLSPGTPRTGPVRNRRETCVAVDPGVFSMRASACSGGGCWRVQATRGDA